MIEALNVATLLTKDPLHRHAIAISTGQIMLYVLDENDLISESTFGILGFLDDAYLVHRFVTLLYQAYPHLARARYPINLPMNILCK
jgi:uncharacterized membrane protein YkvA (DUF1232 family)